MIIIEICSRQNNLTGNLQPSIFDQNQRNCKIIVRGLILAKMKMIETWKESLDKGKCIGTIFMDLSKDFDTLKHDLLIAKLEAYGFTNNSHKYISSYLNMRHLKEASSET